MTVWKIFPSKSAQISAGVFIIDNVPFDIIICDEGLVRVCTCTECDCYVLNESYFGASGPHLVLRRH